MSSAFDNYKLLHFSLVCFTNTNCAVCLSLSDDSQEAFELYYSETYSESSSVSLQDSHRSLASTSDGGDSNPTLMLMQEYMITVSVYNFHHHHHKRKNLTLINCHLTRFVSFKSLLLRFTLKIKPITDYCCKFVSNRS